MGQRTPLFEAHRELGARIVEFAGWDMQVSYSGALDEHRAVRAHCGLFDVSHMGEIELRGERAAAVCQELTANDVSRLGDGDGQYSVLCNDAGGVLDDLVVFRLAADRFMLVVNASNAAADFAWIAGHARDGVAVRDVSAETALLALQGPDAEHALRTLTALDLTAMRPFTSAQGSVAGVPVLVSRTGYTGEDGFELMAAAGDARVLWDAVLAAVRRTGGLPCGLAARDTLRLEAGLPLCGSDMDATTTPLEAGIGWVVKLKKSSFIGREAMMRQAEAGVPRRLVGVQLDEPGIPRHGQVVRRDGAQVGVVTSGTKSPTLGTFIGMAYVEAASTPPGTRLTIEIRERQIPASVVERPFYRRMTAGASHATA
jgi:glycine cleavage system T protein (aminomethyltransferase)